MSSFKDAKDKDIKKNKEQFIKKYNSSLEMIIIYWYFISKLDCIKTCYFTIPINLEDRILLMLNYQNIILFDFNLLSNLSSDKIIEVTIDFNSLDNKLFQQILNFLFKNGKMKTCRLSFFPPEEYFQSQLLLNLYLNSNNSKGIYHKNSIKTNEEVDVFLLKKLSEYYEMNINKFFSFFKNFLSISEFSLIFDIPSILNKIDHYEIILIKLIMNIIIYLDDALNNSKFHLNSLTILADNLFFNNRKHPFLNLFFDQISIYSKKNILIEKLTIKVKWIGITNLYKIIPYNINYLSLGSFDFETFEHFVEYITSAEFTIHSRLKSLQITLQKSIIASQKCFDLISKLLKEHPKNLEEISIYTLLEANYSIITRILKSTNYNKLEKIFIQFGRKTLQDKKMKEIYGKRLEGLKENRDNNFIDLFFVKNNEKNKDKILKLMYAFGKKYNNRFMDYNIFLGIEKCINKNDKKQIIIQYK